MNLSPHLVVTERCRAPVTLVNPFTSAPTVQENSPTAMHLTRAGAPRDPTSCSERCGQLPRSARVRTNLCSCSVSVEFLHGGSEGSARGQQTRESTDAHVEALVALQSPYPGD